jgi:transcriptional regulator with XRE-family HTH domain
MYLTNTDTPTMHSQKRRRRRGVLITLQGLKKLQAAQSEVEISENDGITYTLETLSERTGLDPHTLSKIYTGKVKVDKRSLNRCFRAFNLRLDTSDYEQPVSQKCAVLAGRQEELDSRRNQQSVIQNPKSVSFIDEYTANERSLKIQNRTNLREIPDVSAFFGRTEELANLKHWILEKRSQLVVLLGMGGIGKTWLSVKLTIEIQNQFEFVIWRSLRNAPPLEDLLEKLLRCLSKEPETDLLETMEDRISRLIDYLRTSSCLIIFDNFEAILQQASCNCFAGEYRQGYESYGQLLRLVGETFHQSCFMLTSREKPKGIRRMQGETLPVRVLKLKGLQREGVQEIFRAKGTFSGSTTDWNRLIEHYGGNPLALKLTAITIQNLFDGKIAEFLKQDTLIFGDIRHLLEHQFERLSDAEKEIVNWLASNRQPASLSQLQEQLVSLVSNHKLLEVLESLKERSLIEKNTDLFYLEPLFKEYLAKTVIRRDV